jgi:tRNA threonylcarbamoyladenosine biosynthesis protein TsaE
MSLSVYLSDESATVAFGRRLAELLAPPLCVHLNGTLGSGKTTLVRSILRGRGEAGPVPSPTYTLVEVYQVLGVEVQHFDLYRLEDPEELELIGIRDYLARSALRFFEWPDKGGWALPAADLLFELRTRGEGRTLEISANSHPGTLILPKIGNEWVSITI